MARLDSNGIKIEYESFGAEGADTILLIMGLGTQLTGWPDAFCEMLVQRGYRVIRFDNRDIGLSTHLQELRPPNIPLLVAQQLLRLPRRAPYSLDDMADDAIGVLDALRIDSAHIVGASMGGMIAQLIAGNFPERTRSLTSIMSTTGHRSLPRSEPRATRALMSKPDDPQDPQSVIARSVNVRRVVQSTDYPKSEEELYDAAARSYYRGGYDPAGVARQLAAVITAPQRRALLRRVSAPSLVIHGEADPLVPVECGVDTARHLPDATLQLFPGMGHDLPAALLEPMAQCIHEVAQRAGAA